MATNICLILLKRQYQTLGNKGSNFSEYILSPKSPIFIYNSVGYRNLSGEHPFKNALDELLACDPFGIKPLYYADDGATLQVASQVKALLNGGRIDTTPQPAGHVGFFLWGHVPEPYTLYKGIMD